MWGVQGRYFVMRPRGGDFRCWLNQHRIAAWHTRRDCDFWLNEEESRALKR
jgi:hypothetical protein